MADPTRVDPGNGIAGIAELLKLAGGTKASSTTSSDTSALQGVLGGLKSQDPAALLQTIFTQASGQIPGLQSAMSNAVGARTGGNSAVSAILQKLLQQTTLLGQQQLVDQQQKNLQTQAQVAEAIARGNTTTNQKSGTNLGKAATTLSLLSAGNKLLNSDVVGKAKDLFSSGGLFSGGSNITGAATVGAPALSFSGGDFGGGAVSSGVDSGSANFSDLATGAGDLFSNVGTTISDWFSGGSDLPATFDGVDEVAGAVDSGGSWWDSITDFFGFADGGLVGRDGDEPKGYAEGGIVRSGGGRRSSAPTFELPAINQSIAKNPLPRMNAPRVDGATGKAKELELANDFGGSAQESSMAGQSPNSIGLGQALGIAAMGLMGNVPGAMASAIGVANPMMGAMGKLGLTAMNPTPIGVVSSLLGLMNAISPTAAASESGLSAGATSEGFGGATGSVSAPGIGGGLGSGPSTGFGEVGFGTPGLGLGLGFGDDGSGFGEGSAPGDSGGGPGGDAGGDGMGGGDAAAGYKKGGKVKGPGTSTSDSIPAMLSHGEYVIPADVVQKMGVDFFDALREQFHTKTTA